MFVQIQIVGNIVRDAVLKEYATSKKAVSSVAYTTGYGEKKKSHFLDIEAWGTKADVLKNHALKGTRVMVVGSLEQSEWTDQQGQKRSKHSMTVQEILLLSPKDKALQADMPFGKMKDSSDMQDPATGQVEINLDGLTLPF